MNYDLKSLAVVNLFIVPKHFFVRDIIEERKPLAPLRDVQAGSVQKSCSASVPKSGKIQSCKTVSFAQRIGTRGMAEDAFPPRRITGDAGLAARCHEMRGVARKREFTLDDVYPSNDISVNSIPATRTSGLRYVSSFNTSAIAGTLISSRVEIYRLRT